MDLLIHIIDDDDLVSATLERLITKKGHRALVSRTAEEALQTVTDVVPDLILLDLNLPGINGIELMKRFQADAILANFCPNSQLNDFNPNANIWKYTDKADLLSYTTEFCLESTGTFLSEAWAALLMKMATSSPARKFAVL